MSVGRNDDCRLVNLSQVDTSFKSINTNNKKLYWIITLQHGRSDVSKPMIPLPEETSMSRGRHQRPGQVETEDQNR
jgi:hypothetical protein